MKTLFIAASLALSVVSAFAQNEPPVGKLEAVKGNVSMVQDGKFVSVGNNIEFKDGARIVAGAGSSVTLDLPNGCDIKLTPGQAIVINKSMLDQTDGCKKLAGTVQTLAVGVAGAEAAGGAGLGLNGGQLAAFAFIGFVAYESISPR
jgi:hypothetical protein